MHSSMSETAFDKLNQAKSIVGCRIVRLDCHDELIPYYTSHGFKLITKSDDGRLNQMMAFITAKHNGNPDEGNMSVREFRLPSCFLSCSDKLGSSSNGTASCRQS